MVAICSLWSKYCQWPDEDKHNTIAKWIQQKFLFPNCVGLIDGTLNPFTYEPQVEGAADYSGCKYGYSLSTLDVCDNMCYITYYAAGWPGSAHDNRVFCNILMFQHPTKYFPIGSIYLVIQLMNAALLLLVHTRNHRDPASLVNKKCSTWLYQSHRLNLNM